MTLSNKAQEIADSYWIDPQVSPNHLKGIAAVLRTAALQRLRHWEMTQLAKELEVEPW